MTLILALISIPRLILLGSDYSFFSSKNYYAYPLLIYFLCDLVLLKLDTSKKFVIFRYSILCLILIVLMLSGRRAPLFCALLSLTFFLVKNKKLFFLLLPVLIFFQGIIINYKVLGFSISNSKTYLRLDRLINSGYEDSSYFERLLTWESYLNAYYDKPIIGSGLHSGNYIMADYNSLVGNDFLGYHNTFLQVLVESGILGFFFFILFFFRSFAGLFRHNYIYIPLFLSTIIINLFESNLLPGQIFFFFSFSVCFLFSKQKINI